MLRARDLDLVTQCQLAGLPAPDVEVRFHPTRRWKFDFAFVGAKLAVEQEGGVYKQGRHVRGQGYENDCEKYAEALCLGWRVLRVTPRQIQSGQALAWVQAALETI